jgi:hypothetical protein
MYLSIVSLQSDQSRRNVQGTDREEAGGRSAKDIEEPWISIYDSQDIPVKCWITSYLAYIAWSAPLAHGVGQGTCIVAQT